MIGGIKINYEKVVMDKDEYEAVHRLLSNAISESKDCICVADELIIAKDLLYRARPHVRDEWYDK